MINIWNTLLFHPLLNLLIGFTRLTGSLGWSIISLTLFLRLIMTPVILPSLRLGKKMQELAPELAKLKEKFKDDKAGLLTAQTALYKQHGASPASGCLPQVIQLLVLIALFNALNFVIKENGNLTSRLNPVLYNFNQVPQNFQPNGRFLYLDMAKPDVFRIPNIPIPLPGLFLLLSALTQFISSKMMAPEVAREKKIAAKTETSTDDAMVEVQQQMLYMFPLMTLLIGFQFPSGLVLYWLTFSFVSAIQQYYATGWGGLTPWIRKLGYG